MNFTATYSPDDNKLRLYASSRLPEELYKRVRAVGFIWAPKQKLFVAPRWTPEAEDLLLELAGDIGDEDKSLTERQEERAERFEEYSDKRGADAERAHEAVASIADNIPLGQPILVGHHSERHARRDAERIENGMRKAVKMWETSKYWTQRAEGAIHHALYKQEPEVRARRIKGLEADQRKQQRTRTKFADLLDLYTNPKYAEMMARDGRNMRYAVLSSFGGGLSYENQTALEKKTLSFDDAIARAIRQCNGVVAHCDRWIAHLNNRLTYERVMLDDQGASDLIAPKARPKQLPLCNYRAPDGLDAPNLYKRGEMEKLPQKEMTSAEYAKIYDDYKGTRVIDRSHRVRVAMIRRTGEAHYVTDRVCVFLTDSKAHKRPAPAPEVQAPLPDLKVSTYVHKEPERTKFDALKESLRAGVKAVSAPQLFPTPPELARRIVAAADAAGLSGRRVLEPSAGTGNLLKAIIDSATGADCCRTVAVEIDPRLCTLLEQQRNLTLYANEGNHKIVCGDFLQCNGDLGTFDRIVMNPPFADGQDMRHVEHALHMLKPGGRLVAVMSPGFTFRQDRQATAFRAMIEERGGVVEPLPDDSFKDSGTGVRTVLVTIDS